MEQETLFSKFLIYIIIIFSATIHEFFHGWMAYYLGDSTAKDEGRLTINPLKHIDPLGTVILPIFLLMTSGMFIGWAKPVPYNPNNLSDRKYGSLKVALAGPASNFLIALIIGLILRFSAGFNLDYNFLSTLSLIVIINISLLLFNLIPLPPLDGSKILFDLFPQSRNFLEGQIGFLGIILVLFFGGQFLAPITRFIYFLIVG
ncbi:site-2 protease family protein [Candidatus Azambacteria bacterium]|nr:site-2 protease family protein [Candidatus Azambacteria bacterium]